MNILLAYDSLSGNTREASRLIREALASAGHDVTEICVSATAAPPHALSRAWDLHVLGTWTGGLGRTPAGMKAFVARLASLPPALRPTDVALFGTGETQWGLPYFCGALDRLAAYFKTGYPLLKIEQMPTNEKTLREIADWVRTILEPKAAARQPA
ncbi:flavodoxin [Opitutaceae bacterium TAV1]|nr:flavodoxin [Opitutaceae bacterium TAV1]